MDSAAQEPAWLYSPLAQNAEFSELVDLFVAEMPQRISSLLARLQARDWEELRRAAHQLKGAGGSYGFAPITPAAARVEQAIANREPDADIRRAVEELAGLCRRIRSGTP